LTEAHEELHDATKGEPLLAATGLACFRGDRQLFRDMDVILDEGHVVHIAGPNGSGKTTLLRVLCGLRYADEGEIRWRGEPLEAHHGEFLSELCYVGHSDGVKMELSAAENLRIAAALSARADMDRAREWLASFQLREFADVPCRTLSAGQRRRVALARLALGGARLWVLDEPFTALDKAGGDTFYALLEAHLEGGGAAILTSHQRVELDAGVTSVVELHR
jgi:heme exporter protein A